MIAIVPCREAERQQRDKRGDGLTAAAGLGMWFCGVDVVMDRGVIGVDIHAELSLSHAYRVCTHDT